MSDITCLKPGVGTSFQDSGRLGRQHLGIPIGGPMDQRSCHLANFLVNNIESAPVIECNLHGPDLKFYSQQYIAITGADMQPLLNGQHIKMNQLTKVMPGDILHLGYAHTGCRSYIAVAGSWDLPPLLGSVSPLSGYPDHGWLRTNRSWKVQASTQKEPNPANRFEISPTTDYSQVIRLWPAPETHLLSVAQMDMISSQGFGLTPECSRMGYRLSASPIIIPQFNMISSGVIPGTIQLLPDGQLVILMRDCQTTGGYPRVAIVDYDDLNILAQKKHGDTITFRWHQNRNKLERR